MQAIALVLAGMFRTVYLSTPGGPWEPFRSFHSGKRSPPEWCPIHRHLFQAGCRERNPLLGLCMGYTGSQRCGPLRCFPSFVQSFVKVFTNSRPPINIERSCEFPRGSNVSKPGVRGR